MYLQTLHYDVFYDVICYMLTPSLLGLVSDDSHPIARDIFFLDDSGSSGNS